MNNTLFFGDNLDILREHIAAESVDLIYLDPPFNSKRDYNLLFKTPKGHVSEAQITAFEDSWHWGEQAEHEFDEILRQANTNAAELIQSLRRFLHENDMMAYLVMMCNRLLELHRVLKSTGSLYLHCDPTASHYLKVMADAVFDVQNFRSEIIWKRTSAHSSAKRYGPVHDTVLFYSRTDNFVWNQQYEPLAEEYVASHYRSRDENGRQYTLSDLTAAGTRQGSSGQDWRGFSPISKGIHWKFTIENLERLDAEGRIHWPSNGGWPRYKRYLDEVKGVPLQDVWTSIDPLNAQAAERLGYPTQKPLALLERIIGASSNPGDIVLDPFCGCGTAIHAAHRLRRGWIGIDITPLAIGLIEKRMKEAFPGIQFAVEGIPKDLDGAKDLAARDKYHFQWWACSLVSAQPYQGRKKGADSGIDGVIYFADDKGPAKKIIVSVKGGDAVNVAQVRDLAHVVLREEAQIGLFVTLAQPTKPMKLEAIKAGYYESAHHGIFSRIQILTIEGLLNGAEAPRYPDLTRGSAGSRKAKIERAKSEQQELL